MPIKIKSGKETLLYIYGNLFYAAAADTFEKSLLAVEDASQPIVILLLRGYEEVGSTVREVFCRYTQALQANHSKLILVSVFRALRAQLQRTGMMDLIGKENIFLKTKAIGEPSNAALSAATEWLVGSSSENNIGEDKEEDQ